MASDTLSRQAFLKLCGASLGSLAFRPPRPFSALPVGLGRVTIETIYIYAETSFQSKRIGHFQRDQIVSLLEEIQSETGYGRNKLWYRVRQGYVHSAYIQRVENADYTTALAEFPAGGSLGEVTVPYVRSYRYTRADGWQPVYRLYYQTLHWIEGIDEGPGGVRMYRLFDNLLNTTYFVQALCMRPVSPTEYAPISPNVPADEKKIIVSISEQRLTAFEGDQAVYTCPISSGVPQKEPSSDPQKPPTDTPEGSFRIRNKMPSRHMGDGKLTSEILAYELPGVPWVMFFHKDGFALHGTFWHNNFGVRMSHGCVNLRNADARWLFRWTEPAFDPAGTFSTGEGSVVQIFA